MARRLLIGAGVWCLIVLFGGAFALSALYRAQTTQLLDAELESELVALTRAVQIGADGTITGDPARLPSDQRYETPLSGRYWMAIGVNPDGGPGDELRSDSMWDGEAPLTEEIARAALSAPGTPVFANTVGPADERLRIAARVVILSEAGQRVMVLAGADRAETDQGARQFLLLLVGAMIVLAGGVLLAMIVQVRVVLGPLQKVQTDVASVRAGERRKLDEDYPVEVRPLTEELNKLIDHNQSVVERARTHVGNLAHALKTPLAVLRNEATGETPLDDVVRRQTEAMHANVQHYLKRAQAAARAQTIGARTDVAPLVEGLVRLLSRLFEDRGVSICASVHEHQRFRGESQDLEEMLGNLMENACKWARDTVQVSVSGPETGFLTIHVDDDGPGLDEGEREAALQRGVRLDETAPGTGLGLSIVNELAELYGGALRLGESPLGGLRVSLKVPAA